MLKHASLVKYNKWDRLFESSSINEFNRKLKIACCEKEKEDPGAYDFLEMLGHGGEILTECLFRLNECNKRFGIKNYAPIVNDKGVDGSGILYNNKMAMVQVKWYLDPTLDLTATGANLNSFWGEGQFALLSAGETLVVDELPRRLILVTTAKGLHHYTAQEKFSNQIRVIGYEELCEELNGNMHFWNAAREFVKLSMP